MTTIPRARVNSFGVPGPRGMTGAQGEKGDPGGVDGVSVMDHAATGLGVADDTAAFIAASAAAVVAGTFVYVSPGTYKIGSSAGAWAASFEFAIGAELLVVPSAGGVTFSGVRARVRGLVARVATTSAASFEAVTISGAYAVADDVTIFADVAIANATLLKVAGAGARVNGYKIVGSGFSFLRGLDLRQTGGGSVEAVTVDGMTAQLGDSGVTATYEALVSMHCVDSVLKDLTYEAGGRDAFPNGVIRVETGAGRNTIENPQLIGVSGATYGIYQEDSAEFLTIRGGKIQGRNNGTFPGTDTQGIYSGHLAGHLKLTDGVLLTGWDWGVGFHGSHDTPQFYGTVIANNGSGGILIDSDNGAGPWPVSGLTLSGCYHEEVIQDNDQFIFCKTGSLIGAVMTGCLIGYENRVLKVDAGFTTCVFAFGSGNRLSGDASAAVCEPHATSVIYFSRGSETDGTNTIATGAHADRVIIESAPVLDGITVGTAAVSVAGTAIKAIFSDTYTLNFGDILAGAEQALTFFYSGLASTDEINVTLQNALYAKAGISFKWGITSADHFGVTAKNTTGSTVTGITGNARITVIKY